MDDERHLEVTAVPASALVAAPEGARPAAAERERTALAKGPEPDERDDREQLDELDSGPATGWPTRFGRINGLKVALTLAVAVALALAGALYVTQRQTDDEREITAAIERYTAAWNAHDVAAVRAAMFPNGGIFAASDNITREAMLVAPWGPELDRTLTALFGANVTLETRGRVTITGDHTRASVLQRFSYTVYGLRVVEDGVSLYSLTPAERGTGLKVEQHVWWRPRVPASPSMLWILDAPTRNGG
jgi:hypothetical protein